MKTLLEANGIKVIEINEQHGAVVTAVHFGASGISIGRSSDGAVIVSGTPGQLAMMGQACADAASGNLSRLTNESTAYMAIVRD